MHPFQITIPQTQSCNHTDTDAGFLKSWPKMEDRREIEKAQYNISNTFYAASAHLTPTQQRAWW